MPRKFEFSAHLHETKQHFFFYIYIFQSFFIQFCVLSKVETFTCSNNTCIFCSAKRLAIQDLGPCPKGSKTYGCTGFAQLTLLFSIFSRSHRSGMNASGSLKYSGRRQII